jgi:hypothetical protein
MTSSSLMSFTPNATMALHVIGSAIVMLVSGCLRFGMVVSASAAGLVS